MNARFKHGESVVVKWMGEYVTASVAQVARPRYALLIPGVTGNPWYEEHEIASAGSLGADATEDTR